MKSSRSNLKIFRLCDSNNFLNSKKKTHDRKLLMYLRVKTTKKKDEQTYSAIAISTVNFTVRTYKDSSVKLDMQGYILADTTAYFQPPFT